jgi:predicted  nucleic acid-binding Zn-ribbon protein
MWEEELEKNVLELEEEGIIERNVRRKIQKKLQSAFLGFYFRGNDTSNF